ncbi:hypothetical protein EDB83DRAFT_729665 [Lactarius deliciosus]|nr:hypothetical protein EDB83DRAFT_729665 [Lactarius deliciosus]
MFRTSASHAFQGLNIPQIPSEFATGGSYAQPEMAALPRRSQAPASNPIDSLHARQSNMLVADGQQQQNGFASRVGPPQGQGPLQQNFIQPSPSVPPANLQFSVVPSASQPTPLVGTQMRGHHESFAEMPAPQLFNVYSQLVTVVEGGAKILNAAGTGCGSDIQRQALRSRLDSQMQLLTNIRDLIISKRLDDLWQFNGDFAQQAVNGAPWSGANQPGTGLYSMPECPPQYYGHSPANQVSVNQILPQGKIPTPQQSFVPSVTTQSDLTQILPHVSGNGLPFNGALAQIPGAPAQQPPQAPRIQCSELPPLPEGQFKALFMQHTNTTGLRLNGRDFVIDGRPVSPWALHRAVFARNGFESVCSRSLKSYFGFIFVQVTANDEWPAVGAALGFPSFPAGGPTRPLRCAPIIAHRLQQLYNDYLSHFERAVMHNVISRLRSSQAFSQVCTQACRQQAQPHRPTDAGY